MGVSFDPLARFLELEAAFAVGRGVLGDPTSLRLASAHLVLTPGEPAVIAEQVRAAAARIEAGFTSFTEMAKPLCLLIGAVVLQRGDHPAAFMAELERVRPWMRAHELRRSQSHEAIAILALRICNGLAPITDEQIARMRAIYDELKRHQYLLTGPEELPACAFFVGQHESTPEQIGVRAYAIYEGLRERGKLWSGDPLQLASTMLALSPFEPGELIDRFVGLVHELERRALKIRANDYDDVAALCCSDRPHEEIAETVASYTATLRERLRGSDSGLTLAANLTLAGMDALTDAKTLLDMQTVIAARRAASF